MDVGTVPDIWAFFDRCTMEGHRAVFHARQAVADLGGQAITPEHLLCGLLNADVLASRHFVTLPMAGGELKDRVAALLGGGGVPGGVDVPLSTEKQRLSVIARFTAIIFFLASLLARVPPRFC